MSGYLKKVGLQNYGLFFSFRPFFIIKGVKEAIIIVNGFFYLQTSSPSATTGLRSPLKNATTNGPELPPLTDFLQPLKYHLRCRFMVATRESSFPSLFVF